VPAQKSLEGRIVARLQEQIQQLAIGRPADAIL